MLLSIFALSAAQKAFLMSYLRTGVVVGAAVGLTVIGVEGLKAAAKSVVPKHLLRT